MAAFWTHPKVSDGTLYSWTSKDIPEPPEDLPLVIPTDAKALIRQAVSRLLSELDHEFVLPPHTSLIQTVNDTPSELNRIDHDVQRLRSAMLAIKYDFAQRIASLSKRRNALTIFSKLPTELSGIVLGHSLDGKNRHGDFGEPARIERLKDLAMVSSDWGRVVKSCPALWTTIEGYNLLHISLHIQKSGTLPLTVYGSHNGDPGPEYIDLVTSQCHRWSSVQCYFGRVDLLASICRRLETPMPLLESLTLGSTPVTETVAPVRLAGSARFRELSLSGVIPHPDSPALKTVRRLSLSRVFGIPVSKILLTVASAAALEFLRIESMGEHNSEGLPTLQLPNLRTLELANLAPLVVNALLTSLHTKGLSTLRVMMSHQNDNLPVLHQLMTGEKGSIISTVISNACMKNVKLRIAGDSMVEISGDSGELGCINVCLYGEGWTEKLSTMECFPGFASHLPDVQVVLKDEDKAGTTTSWNLAFLLEMPSVVSMEIRTYGRLARQAFTSMLGEPHLACPRLTLVRIVDYRIPEEILKALYSEVRDALKARQVAKRVDPLPSMVVQREWQIKGITRNFTEVATISL